MPTSKLRTYGTYSMYEAEQYVYSVCNRAHRSILAQFRTGIKPVKIETEGFIQIPLELRLCISYEEDSIEDEKHFFLNVFTIIP